MFGAGADLHKQEETMEKWLARSGAEGVAALQQGLKTGIVVKGEAWSTDVASKVIHMFWMCIIFNATVF